MGEELAKASLRVPKPPVPSANQPASAKVKVSQRRGVNAFYRSQIKWLILLPFQ